jgi:hypothetical protein
VEQPIPAHEHTLRTGAATTFVRRLDDDASERDHERMAVLASVHVGAQAAGMRLGEPSAEQLERSGLAEMIASLAGLGRSHDPRA